jgi:hypothetical protein
VVVEDDVLDVDVSDVVDDDVVVVVDITGVDDELVEAVVEDVSGADSVDATEDEVGE